MTSKSPQIYLIAGPNGAGKTTFARQFLPSVGIVEFLNADAIAAGLSPLDPPTASFRAARLLISRWREMVRQGRSFGFESTLSGRTYATMLRNAKSRGFQVSLCYLHLATIRHSIRRVRERVKKGGHDVPLADLHRRFLPSLINFFSVYLPLADRALLYGATSWPPELVVEWNHAKSTILNRAAYEKILSKVNRT